MARSNTGSSSNRLTNATGGGVTAAPFTLACWFNPVNLTSNNNLVFVTNTGITDFTGILFDGTNTYGLGDNVVIADTAAPGEVSAASPTGGAAGVWMHCAGVFASTTSRQAFLNGVGGTVETTSRAPASPQETHIGILATSSSPINGSIAEVCIWNTDLTAAEVLSLARGHSPLLVRSNNLVRYWPIYGRGTETCLVSGQTLTVTGTMAQAAHVQGFRPRLPILGRAAAGAAKTLAAVAGSYAYTGSVASTLHAYKPAAAPSSYAMTGTTATTKLGRRTLALASSYAMTGTDATIGTPVSRSLTPRNPTAFLPFLVR